LRSTIEKFLFYTLSIVVVFIVDEVFFNNSSHLASIIGAYIALTEIISIFENIAVITGHDVFIKIKEVIRDTLTDKLTKKTGTNP
jgi:phage-related holin